MWYITDMILQIKYYYVGIVYHLDDIWNAKYNKTGKKQRGLNLFCINFKIYTTVLLKKKFSIYA